jgi:hypothetical protein
VKCYKNCKNALDHGIAEVTTAEKSFIEQVPGEFSVAGISALTPAGFFSFSPQKN